MKSLKNITLLLAGFAALQACKRDVSLEPKDDKPGNELPGLHNAVFADDELKVYFHQNFDASTNINDYIGNGQHQFNAITSAGDSASINVLNHTLQIVKTGGTGINRAGATKTRLIQDGPASLLKYSIKVKVSNNTNNGGEEVPNGFQFTVGNITSTAPAAPPQGQIHSIFRINPAAEEGEFVIEAGLDTDPDKKRSEPVSGTVTLVWFINNSGTDLGYTAPDGLPGSVANDASDIWVVDQAGNVSRAIDEAPAVSPGVALRNFKFANNPNFRATLDMDDIHLAEAKSIPVPKIKSVSHAPAIEVPRNTVFELLPLLKKLEVTYENNTTDSVLVRWEPVGKYNSYTLGEYKVKGVVIPNRGTINPGNYADTTIVKIRNDIRIVNAFTPNGDGKNDTWINPELKYYQNSSVEVFDRNGVRLFYSTNPEEGWDGRNQYGQIVPGSYSYIIKVPHLSLIKKGVVTVIK